MKPTIILLLCISCICSFGQVKLHNENEGLLYQSSMYDDSKDSMLDLFNYDTLRLQGETFVRNTKDTIPILMLVCDTSNRNERMAGQIPFYNQDIFWVKGYKVDKNNYTALGTAYYPTEYLDENRKPLSKNIIVWQSK